MQSQPKRRKQKETNPMSCLDQIALVQSKLTDIVCFGCESAAFCGHVDWKTMYTNQKSFDSSEYEIYFNMVHLQGIHDNLEVESGGNFKCSR